MRVLHVTPYYEPAYVYGGPARSVPLLCRGLVSQGVSVTVYTSDANGRRALDVPVEVPVWRDGVEVYYFRRNWGERYFYSRALGRACLADVRCFDLVHVSGVWTYPLIPVATACRKHKVPYLVSPRNSFMQWGFEQKKLKKHLYLWLGERERLNGAAEIHYTSEYEREDSRHIGLLPPSFLVPNPVELEEFDHLPPRGLLRQRLGIADRCPMVLLVGRLHEKKGFTLAIPAVAAIRRMFPDLHFVVVGPDEKGYRKKIEELVAEYGLERWTHLTGLLSGEERLSAYSDADIFVLPSFSENFGNAVVEAMAAGIPVVVSDRVGVAADVAAGGAGLVVTLDPEAVAQGLGKLLSCHELREQMSLRAKELARTRFSPDAVALSMRRHYERILSRWRVGNRGSR